MVAPLPQSLFIYGTLQAPEVLEAVAGRAFASEPARLDGYRRFTIPGVVFPGIVPDAQGQVDGHLLLQVDPVSWALFDKYEPGYERRTVLVRTARGAVEPAETYVWLGKTSPKPWDYAEFRARHLRKYVADLD